MRKIVLPIDFSDNSANAFRYAVSLFNEKTKFYPFHIEANNSFSEEEGSNRQKQIDKCKVQLDEMVSEIQEQFPNTEHEFETFAGCSYLVDELKDFTKEKDTDLIVMGTRGATNDRELTFGSHALQILKQVDCPVLCVPEGYQYKKPKKLLFSTNFMIPYQEQELQLVAEILDYYKAELHILHISKFGAISKRQKENLEKLTNHLNMPDVNFHQVFETEDQKAHAINQKIQELDIDLLVMVNSRYTFLENLLHQSTVDKIGLNPKIPFLVLQNFRKKPLNKPN